MTSAQLLAFVIMSIVVGILGYLFSKGPIP
jgi:hypothetical protein